MNEPKQKLSFFNRIKKRLVVFRNKFVLTSTIFLIYFLFLDENDVFTLISHQRKLSKIKAEHEVFYENLKATRHTLRKLHFTSEVERYAREEKLFKKDDEDIFILSNE
jgi:hypothetical protein